MPLLHALCTAILVLWSTQATAIRTHEDTGHPIWSSRRLQQGPPAGRSTAATPPLPSSDGLDPEAIPRDFEVVALNDAEGITVPTGTAIPIAILLPKTLPPQLAPANSTVVVILPDRTFQTLPLSALEEGRADAEDFGLPVQCQPCPGQGGAEEGMVPAVGDGGGMAPVKATGPFRNVSLSNGGGDPPCRPPLFGRTVVGELTAERACDQENSSRSPASNSDPNEKAPVAAGDSPETRGTVLSDFSSGEFSLPGMDVDGPLSGPPPIPGNSDDGK